MHVDPERAAAAGKAFCLMAAVWLAWHFLPDAWEFLNGWLSGWLGALWHVLAIPFVLLGSLLRAIGSAFSWIAGIVDSAFRVAAVVQAAFLPVCALLAGCCMGREDVKDGCTIWVAAAGLNALCAVLLGCPALAGMVVVGSTAAFVAAMVLAPSLRNWGGWLAAALVGGLSVWGFERYGTAFLPVCWLVVPLSWCSLVLGAAYGVRLGAGGWLRDRGAARLLLLASALAIADACPFAVDAARAALAGGTLPAPVLHAPAAAMDGLPGREGAGSAMQARLPAPAGAPHRGGQDATSASATQSKRPRT